MDRALRACTDEGRDDRHRALRTPVSAEILHGAAQMIRPTLEVREEDPEMKERLEVIVTSVGSPSRWTDVVKPIPETTPPKVLA